MPTTYTHIASNKRRSILLVFFFIGFLVFLGWLFGELSDFGYAGLVFALGIAGVLSLTGYYTGDRIALWTAGAQPIAKEQNPSLFRIVENLCLTAGLPMPKVHVIPDPAMNAFATGRDPKTASLAVTTGLIEKLENEELEGVIAHELSHIGNYDVRFLTLVAVLVGAIALLGDFFLRAQWMGVGRRNRNGGGALLLIGLVFAILAPIAAQLIQLAVSRRREFLADASGALLTRYPEGLARALEKISGSANRLQRASGATAHLYFSSPFGATAGGLSRLFSTHPPIEQRIRVLREMAGKTN